MIVMRSLTGVVLAAVAAQGVAAQEQGSTAGDATLRVAESEPFGAYIVGPEGKPVYMFTTDTQGDGSEPEISCEEDCLEAWPLVHAEGDEPSVGPQLDESLVGTMSHEGETVVTYNGWPLYTFARDTAGASPEGQDIHSFGGEWYLLTPEGEKLETEG